MILIAPSFDARRHGGIERVSRQVLKALESGSLGREGHLVLSSNDEPGGTSGRVAYGGRYAAMMMDAFQVSLEGKSGPVLCLHAGLAPVGRVLAGRLKSELVVFLHGVEVWRKLPLRTRWGLAGAQRLLANSRFTLEQFAKWHPNLAATPSTVVPLGLPAEFGGQQSGASSAEGFILTVSRLSSEDAYKGHEVLMDAVLELRKGGQRVKLVLVGSGDAELSLKERADQSGDPSAFDFKGNVSDEELARLYQSCAIFALLSEGEGFGLVHLEAMSRGKPCVATSADAAAEIVREGMTGKIVPPRNAAAAARAIRELLEDPAAAARMGEAARKQVQENFLEHHFIERLREALA